jgi:acyl-CoA synthetase (AMP-forming)/AMP-acid ligase II/acyl carrier protein
VSHRSPGVRLNTPARRLAGIRTLAQNGHARCQLNLESPPEPTTLVSEFLRHVEVNPSAIAIRYLHDGDVDGPTTTWSYAELCRRALAIAAGLYRADIRVGDRALLLYTECLGFAEAFMGCLLAGVVPIPVAAPETTKLARALSRLRTIATISGANTLLTAPSLIARVTQLFLDGETRSPLAIMATWGDAKPLDMYEPPRRAGDDIAFVQFTSGSTSDPKGVIITHANLAANQRITSQAMSVNPNTNFVSWLPVHHDMGLIGALLLALWNGRPITSMLPQHFMERPARWLEAISGQQAVMSGGPNFAFSIVARKLSNDAAARLDLSGWQTAYCGSEPIRHEVMREFVDRLAPRGLRPQALVPCYGLAESTLFVCAARPWTAAPEAGDGTVLDGFVICGRPGPGIELAIVDPVLRSRCDEGQEGEVWLRGPNVGRGYWADTEHTARTFGAQIEGVIEGGAWLRTGDLGRTKAGALYITGRLKDLIIINGRNIYPQDVELAIDHCHRDVRPGCAAAFMVSGDGSEAIGVAFEVRVDRASANALELANQQIVAAACAAVARVLDVQPAFVALLPAGASLKTTSGKPQRRATRDALADGSLTPLFVWRAARAPIGAGSTNADVITALAAWISTHSGRVLVHDHAQAGLDELGIDSIAKAELLDWIHETFGRRLTMDQLLAQASLAGLAAAIRGDTALGREARIAEPTEAPAPVLPSLAWLRKT